jgi:DNA-binding NtrC family response regulator
MVCVDADEASLVGQELLQVNSGALLTYRKVEDILLTAPAGRVVLIIMAGNEAPVAVDKALNTMRHRWPRSPVVVIGEPGDRELELAARRGGASYLVRPVRAQEWTALVQHAFGKRTGVTSEEVLG